MITRKQAAVTSSACHIALCLIVIFEIAVDGSELAMYVTSVGLLVNLIARLIVDSRS